MGRLNMGRLKTLLVCGGMLAMSGALAHAADMPAYPPLPMPHSGPQIEQFVSGWYIRGDVGWRFAHVGEAYDSIYSYDGDNSIKSGFVGGLGAGFKARWLRLDVTGDYGWRSEFTGETADGAASVSEKVDSFTVMLNGYVDLGTWYGFTPYLGGGIGGALVRTTSYQASFLADEGPNVERWNVAWSAMAGVSYLLTYNTMVDLGYRHVDMGDVIGGLPDNTLTLHHLTGDEFRIGLRYLLD